MLWISGLEKSVKAEDLRIAFEPYGKGNLLHYMVAYHVFQYSTVIKTLVANGKIVSMTVNGIKECHGIFTMRTAKDADNVIKHLNGAKIGNDNNINNYCHNTELSYRSG